NRLWSQIPEETRELLSPDLQAEIKSVALSARGEESLSVDGRYPFVHDIVGNTICADLIDYLQRDHLHTGLPIALGSRFINGAHVLTADHPTHPHRMAVRVSRNAQLRH